jgi:hypothetical protein
MPWSDAALDADHAGIPLLDFAPDDPAVDSVRRLSDCLLEGRVPAPL